MTNELVVEILKQYIKRGTESLMYLSLQEVKAVFFLFHPWIYLRTNERS